MSLGLRIRTLRRTKGLTQQQLADRAEISRIYIQALESNRRTPSMKLLQRISEELDVEAAELLKEYPSDDIGRMHLDELFAESQNSEMWYKGHKLSDRDVQIIRKMLAALLDDPEPQTNSQPRKRA